MSKFEEIVSGWKNYFFKDEEVENKAKVRLKICLECNHINNSNDKCTICGCFIPAKVRSLKSKCPKSKW